VFVDESGTHLNMSRDYARSVRGERAYSRAPYHPGERTNLIAARSGSGIQAPWLVTGGSVDTATFITYVEHILGPTLLAGQIVILDNYTVHTDSKIRDLLAARGCELRFLPTYSPDFNPIEHAFSKIKALLRQVQASTQDALSHAIKQACAAITLQDTLV
jgi:transposase